MREFKGVTFYDAIYHAVALLENGVMVTADKTFYSPHAVSAQRLVFRELR